MKRLNRKTAVEMIVTIIRYNGPKSVNELMHATGYDASRLRRYLKDPAFTGEWSGHGRKACKVWRLTSKS